MPSFFPIIQAVGNLGLANVFGPQISPVVQAAADLTGIAANPLNSIGQGQSFSTIPVGNTRLALYTLVIRGASYGLTSGYTFPISPANIRKESNVLTNFYDVAGSPTTLGVQRIIDLYGQAPVIYYIEGTTGWKLHSTDGFAATGIDSIRALEAVLTQFAQLNAAQVQGQTGQNLYTLEFYDYFRNDFWQVVPCGPQIIRQSRARPLFVDYAFRLAGVTNLTWPSIVSDPLSSFFSTSPAAASTNLQQFGSLINDNYFNQTEAVTASTTPLPGII